jgi:hypothetical protein
MVVNDSSIGIAGLKLLSVARVSLSQRRQYLAPAQLTVSAAFYETVLGFLGYWRTSTRPDYVDWNLSGGDGLLCSIGVPSP